MFFKIGDGAVGPPAPGPKAPPKNYTAAPAPIPFKSPPPWPPTNPHSNLNPPFKSPPGWPPTKAPGPNIPPYKAPPGLLIPVKAPPGYPIPVKAPPVGPSDTGGAPPWGWIPPPPTAASAQVGDSAAGPQTRPASLQPPYMSPPTGASSLGSNSGPPLPAVSAPAAKPNANPTATESPSAASAQVGDSTAGPQTTSASQQPPPTDVSALAEHVGPPYRF